MWGYARQSGGLAALVLMAGCGGAILPSLPSSDSDPTPAVPRIALLNGKVIAAGPNGYCADPNASNPRDGFAIFATCAALDADSDEFGFAGVATVQVGPKGSAIVAGQEAAFVAYLESEDGARTLSRAGDAQTVTVQSTKEDNGAVSVRFTDSAPSGVAGEQALQWRAFVDINGYLVTISVRGLKEAPLARAVGSAMLRQAIEALFNANATDSGATGPTDA